jgi:hypothetical protein
VNGVDNVIRGCDVSDAATENTQAHGKSSIHELLASDRIGARRVEATTIQTVGVKGYDGFTLALVAGGR